MKLFSRELAAAVTATIVACAVAVIVSPAPARAQGTGMERCMAGEQPDERWPFIQYGNTVGVNFPIGFNPPDGIFPNQAIHVIVDRSRTRFTMVNISAWLPEWYFVDGKSQENAPDGSGYPFWGVPKYAAYFRMNNSQTGWVASGTNPDPWAPHPLTELESVRCFPAPGTPVRMITQINDDNIGDNGGAWQFELQIWRNH